MRRFWEGVARGLRGLVARVFGVGGEGARTAPARAATADRGPRARRGTPYRSGRYERTIGREVVVLVLSAAEAQEECRRLRLRMRDSDPARTLRYLG